MGMGIDEWAGCKADKCPYGKEYGDCNTCSYLIRKSDCSEILTGSTTKNDLGIDCISRQAVIDLMMQKWGENFSGDDAMQESIDAIRIMPSVTPQEPQSFKWCTDCKEYDQEKHCCHRYSKVIRDTVAEIEQEPKTGNWIEKEDWDGDVYYECSVCGEPFCLIDGTPTDNMYHFCPNCGAKMIEPQESEEQE